MKNIIMIACWVVIAAIGIFIANHVMSHPDETRVELFNRYWYLLPPILIFGFVANVLRYKK